MLRKQITKKMLLDTHLSALCLTHVTLNVTGVEKAKYPLRKSISICNLCCVPLLATQTSLNICSALGTDYPFNVMALCPLPLWTTPPHAHIAICVQSVPHP